MQQVRGPRSFLHAGLDDVHQTLYSLDLLLAVPAQTRYADLLQLLRLAQCQAVE